MDDDLAGISEWVSCNSSSTLVKHVFPYTNHQELHTPTYTYTIFELRGLIHFLVSCLLVIKINMVMWIMLSGKIHIFIEQTNQLYKIPWFDIFELLSSNMRHINKNFRSIAKVQKKQSKILRLLKLHYL